MSDRLKEIEERLGRWTTEEGWNNIGHIEPDIRYLLERVREPETKFTINALNGCMKENARLRAALEWYAETMNTWATGASEDAADALIHLEDDEGQRARDALEGGEP